MLADNIKHFGEPVYEYDLAQAMEDGYLAACEIRKRDIFLGDMEQAEHETGLQSSQLEDKNLSDPFTGRTIHVGELESRYSSARFEGILRLPDRVKALATDFFDHLLAHGGPWQKTVIFRAGDPHADDIANAMNNLYAAWCARTGKTRVEPYAFKCTGASDGNDLLPDFKGARTHHFIATTVDLISTGVDVPGIRNIAFARYLRSPILFYQMIGRGTRIDAATGNLMFRVWDYTNATRLFGEEFITAASAWKSSMAAFRSSPRSMARRCPSLNSSGKLQVAFDRDVRKNDITLTVEAADTLTGPWEDLAKSVSGAAFSAIAPGAGVSEIGEGNVRRVTIVDAYNKNDSEHPRRFLRLNAKSP